VGTKILKHLHAALTVTWLALSVPAVLWWKNSVPFLVFASVYANVASHWAAWQATRAEDNTPTTPINESDPAEDPPPPKS
jgi:hypothetical protein